jgi:hypothetical protein
MLLPVFLATPHSRRSNPQPGIVAAVAPVAVFRSLTPAPPPFSARNSMRRYRWSRTSGVIYNLVNSSIMPTAKG